jgi:hypothetical protein
MAAKKTKRASRTGAKRATRKKTNLPAGISRIDWPDAYDGFSSAWLSSDA